MTKRITSLALAAVLMLACNVDKGGGIPARSAHGPCVGRPAHSVDTQPRPGARRGADGRLWRRCDCSRDTDG